MNFPRIFSFKSCFSRKNALFLKIFAKKFGGNEKMPTFAIPNETNTVSKHAEVAQLVEHNLAKVGVASSSLVFRSKNKKSAEMLTFVLKNITRRGSIICQSSLCTRDGFFVLCNPCGCPLERGTREHYSIFSITVNYQSCNERHGIILNSKIE